jgi:hypothetical protein
LKAGGREKPFPAPNRNKKTTPRCRAKIDYRTKALCEKMIGQKDDGVLCPIIFLLKTAYFRSAARTGALAGISGFSFAAGH